MLSQRYPFNRFTVLHLAHTFLSSTSQIRNVSFKFTGFFLMVFTLYFEWVLFNEFQRTFTKEKRKSRLLNHRCAILKKTMKLHRVHVYMEHFFALCHAYFSFVQVLHAVFAKIWKSTNHDDRVKCFFPFSRHSGKSHSNCSLFLRAIHFMFTFAMENCRVPL